MVELAGIEAEFRKSVSLRPYTTLRTGGEAEWFVEVSELGLFAAIAAAAQASNRAMLVLGWGSNLLPSDAGVKGLVILNRCRRIVVDPSTCTVEAETGCGFQELFLKTAQAGLAGLEFAVGIPGTLGGALVSNAGAYRSNVSEFLTDLEIVYGGERRWVKPDWMGFAYRDSVLRRANPPSCALLRVRMRLRPGDPKAIYDEAREYQRQRIGKQPAPASAGSFFKNVYDQALADRLSRLPERLRAAGVVPAGYLIEHAGLAGAKQGGAVLSRRHANFMLNVGGATATDVRNLAERVKREVAAMFGVHLEEEVQYVGDWSAFG